MVPADRVCHKGIREDGEDLYRRGEGLSPSDGNRRYRQDCELAE